MARPISKKDPYIKVFVGPDLKKKIIQLSEYGNVSMTTLVVRWSGAAYREMMCEVRASQREDRKQLKKEGSDGDD